jgi:hypothetical protein
MSEDNPKSENPQPDWKDAIGIVTLKLMDSGLAPWALVALFLFGLTWLVTKNLDSKDSLALIGKFGTAHGLAWLGWLVAFVEIPIARWAIKRARTMRNSEFKRLQEEADKARKLLKKHKTGELELES